MDELASSRLLLRPIKPADSEAVFKYRSNAEINKYQGWIPKDIKDVEDFINNRVCRQINQPGTWFQMVIVRKDNCSLIGDIGIHFPAEENTHVELGITLDQNHQGQGFAQEALRTVINYLFLKLDKHKAIASIDPRNKASIKLVERLGFVQEAFSEKSFFVNGEWVDDLVMGLKRQN